MMNKLNGVLLVLLTLVGTAVAGYHFLSPKVVLINSSNQAFDEFIVQLPVNRLSVGPVLSGDGQTVYYSFQKQGGVVTYLLMSDGKELVTGQFSYTAEGEPGRTLRFEINNSQGVISVDRSGL